MELGLSLGDAPSKSTTGVNKSTSGFCMALGMKPQSNDDDDHDDDGHDDEGGGGDGDDDGDGEEHEKYEESIVKEKGGIINFVSNERLVTSSVNLPVQLDLLPSGPVHRHTPFPWSPDNGSSEGGSPGNVAARRGLEVRRMPAVVGTEEATSSFRLEFMSYNGRIGSGSNNQKRGFEIGNDVVELERTSSRASDEDDNGMSKKKLRLSKEQSAYLEETFKEHNTLNPKQKLALAERLHLRPRQVEVWFQNRRARTKLKQTEVDYEYLKRCCETLTDENRRLHKELQELRALKTTSNPFHIRPATTLTMCPSCERVATTSTVVTTSPSTKQSADQDSRKTRSLLFPMSRAQPSSSQHQPATQ
ncbi:homeobox-leucine zipper protein HAT14-like [Rutidosis leptorrhynchoides]|uniref:homeobox-leucine zipper protein HAT14-like n=1 Tax=Rutidosis leptorrhynchoides TaxID=125765 RepID=UPI003A99654A